MKKTLSLAFFAVVFSLLVVSCSDDDEVKVKSRFEKGTFVLNEGSSNATLSFLEDEVDSVANNVFESVNGVKLGQYAQSMAFSDDYMLLVVTTGSGAGYVEVVDKETLTHVESFTSLSYPREIIVKDNVAYVTNGSGEGEVIAIDLETMEKDATTIAVGKGPEKMIVSGNKLYVANSGGYNNDDKTVSVIDLSSKTVVETITVKDCPKDMVMDKDGNLWVYCAGVPDYSNWPNVGISNSGICKVATDYTVTEFSTGNIATSGIKNIAINKEGTTIYYITDAIYKLGYQDDALPTAKFVTPENTPYGIDVDPVTGDVYVCEFEQYGMPGKVVAYSTDGTKGDVYEVGVMPNSCLFQ